MFCFCFAVAAKDFCFILFFCCCFLFCVLQQFMNCFFFLLFFCFCFIKFSFMSALQSNANESERKNSNHFTVTPACTFFFMLLLALDLVFYCCCCCCLRFIKLFRAVDLFIITCNCDFYDQQFVAGFVFVVFFLFYFHSMNAVSHVWFYWNLFVGRSIDRCIFGSFFFVFVVKLTEKNL